MTPTNFSAFLWTPRNSPWRWLLACAATVSALAHLPVISAHLAQAPYMGEEFIVLTAACLLVALAVIICDSAAAYSLGLLTGGLAMAGYLATRLIAFPQLAADVGNWFEPLGVISVLAESLVVVAAIGALRAPRRPAADQSAIHPAATAERRNTDGDADTGTAGHRDRVRVRISPLVAGLGYPIG